MTVFHHTLFIAAIALLAPFIPAEIEVPAYIAWINNGCVNHKLVLSTIRIEIQKRKGIHACVWVATPRICARVPCKLRICCLSLTSCRANILVAALRNPDHLLSEHWTKKIGDYISSITSDSPHFRSWQSSLSPQPASSPAQLPLRLSPNQTIQFAHRYLVWPSAGPASCHTTLWLLLVKEVIEMT